MAVQPAYFRYATRLIVVGGLAVALCGCMSGGRGLESAMPDDSITTSSIASKSSGPVDAERASDEATIRNAVSSAYLEEIGHGRIPWANLDTGSRGEISEITEYSEKGVTCRRFKASRESFQGVGLFRGDACHGANGNWWIRLFEAV